MTNYNKLQFDSELFGYDVANIVDKQLNKASLKSILANMSKNGIKLAYWSVDPTDKSSNNAALAVSGFLADEKITYFKRLNGHSTEISEFITSVLNHPISNKLLSLALQSGEYSRFKIDPKFKNNEFNKLYKIWIENSLNGKIAKDVLIYKVNSDELGLITIGVKNNRCDIGLLAVDENSRGKSVGKHLVNAAFKRCQELGYNEIQVVTQKANVNACLFYEKIGFKLEKIENIYHFWL